ncbi:hypothetical protein AA0X95_18425 [Bacillus sp. 1P10SD]|uniref:hypothetical protein n=1 Tax=Bacillus sp. 1P10SD TaxID=3132265 RepID=UPI0039A545D5
MSYENQYLDEQLENIGKLMNLSYKYHITKIKFSLEQIKLFEEEKKDILNDCIKKLSKEMEGSPELIIQFQGEDKPIYDT